MPSATGHAYFHVGAGRAGPFYGTLDQVEGGDPPYLEVAKGGAGYPQPSAFTDGVVTRIDFQPQSGAGDSWASWSYSPNLAFDRFDNLS